MEDRICDFPDDVSMHIQSFLTFKEAVRSALLSPRWSMLNPSLTCSSLDFRDLFIDSCNYSSDSTTVKRKNRRSFNIMDKAIERRQRCGSNLVMEKFAIFLSYDIGFSTRYIQQKLYRWIKCLARPGLAVLDLKVMEYFYFPLDMVSTSETTTSLKVLSLDGFKLSSPVGTFASLHSLNLTSVLFDDCVLETILKVSPKLEKILLSECVGLKTLNIKGFLHLKMLHVEFCTGLQNIDIDSETLEVLVLSPPQHMITIASLPPDLRKLEFCDGYYFGFPIVVKFQGLQLSMDMFFDKIFNLCRKLEELKIDTFQYMSISLNALKTLHLTPQLGNMVKFDILAPNLKKFYIDVYKNIPIISLDASDKLEVTVHFNVYDPSYDQLVEFLGAFNNCRAIKLLFFKDEGFIGKEMRKKLASPLHTTKCLEFHIYCLSSRRLSDYVDYMLWLSPKATNLKIVAGFLNHSTTEIVLECVYEQNGIAAEDLCLKEVRIEEFLGDEVDKTNVKSFFLEQIENLSIKETSFDSESIECGLYSSYNELFEET